MTSWLCFHLFWDCEKHQSNPHIRATVKIQLRLQFWGRKRLVEDTLERSSRPPNIGCPDFPLGYPPDFPSEIHGVPVQKIHGSKIMVDVPQGNLKKNMAFWGYVLNLNTSELAMNNTWPRAAWSAHFGVPISRVFLALLAALCEDSGLGDAKSTLLGCLIAKMWLISGCPISRHPHLGRLKMGYCIPPNGRFERDSGLLQSISRMAVATSTIFCRLVHRDSWPVMAALVAPPYFLGEIWKT